MSLTRILSPFFIGCALLICACTGCTTVPPPPNVLTRDIPNNDQLAHPIGKELDKVSLPTYRISPPDILTITATRIIQKDYKIHPADALSITSEGTLTEQPIRGIFVVDNTGSIQLGPSYGKVTIGGYSIDEATEIVENHLKHTLRQPQVAITLAESSGLQSIYGQHQLGPDGTISLGTYGNVQLTNLTIQEATEAIEKHLSKFLESPKVAVEIFQFASMKYTVITEGAGYGDNVQTFMITGNETVLDAIAQIQGISRFSNKNIYIARPAPGGGCDQIIPVNWEEITKGANTETNYQIMPGDRIILEENRMIALDSAITKIIAPFERIMNVSLLGANTVQSFQRFPTGQ